MASPTVADVRRQLGELTLRDERRLRRRLDAVDPTDIESLDAIAAEAGRAIQKVVARRAAIPAIRYPSNLPITEKKDDILAAIRDHPVVVVAGETGSGKSTQLPKMCLELGRGVRGTVGHTQPRRIAARAVAERVAEELGTELGRAIGYTVRFTDRVRDTTLVKVMTDGILLAEIQRDRQLWQYDTIIVDEAHERSLNIDFILGYLKQLLRRRRDMRVIVTSATIDTERFSRHFDDAPIIEVSGRAYPVDIVYAPYGIDPEDERDQTQAICDAVDVIGEEGDGDVLVFLSGEREIRDTAEALGRMALPRTEVMPLYARLTAAEQHRVFQPHDGRRIVLATNVAETSLTVPGIRYVIDPGTARISRYNRRTKVQRLPIEPVSQASANQRAGRCGRVGPGLCVRLYSEDDYQDRPEFTEPEILRTNLASVILQMTAARLGDIRTFPFVEPPDDRNIGDGIALLEELGALRPGRGEPGARLTGLGRKLAALPVDPRLGRMVIEAAGNGTLHEVTVIAAALSIQDPREWPEDNPAASQSHARFTNADSDFLTYLNLWEYLQEAQARMSSSQFRRLCRAEFFNYLRVREWQDLHRQLREVARDLRIGAGATSASTTTGHADNIHQALLSGLLSHVGMRDGERFEYVGARNSRFALVPNSALFRKSPPWVMSAELVETTRLWARVNAAVQPEWAERLGNHLAKRSYGQPWWDRGRGMAMTNERVTVFGLPVVASRRVAHARANPSDARDMFIQHALVEGEWDGNYAFVDQNKHLVDDVRAMEDKRRQRGMLVTDDVLFAFYDERVGPDVVSSQHFDRWWKDERVRSPSLLNFTRDLLIEPDAAAPRDEEFPDYWDQDVLRVPLEYRFEPGSSRDGVTVHIPLAALGRVQRVGFDWLVPGLREELATEMIRSMPKTIRRSFVPAPEYARAAVQRLAGREEGSFADALRRELARMTGDPVPLGSIDTTKLPPHLRMHFAVDDDDGIELGFGDDLDALRHHFEARRREHLSTRSATASIERTGSTAWTFGPIPRVLRAGNHTTEPEGYPALVDEGESVGLRVFPSAAEQAAAMWAGTRRLLLLGLPSPRRAVETTFTNTFKLSLASGVVGTAGDVVDDIAAAAVDTLLAAKGGPRWDEPRFAELRLAVRDEFGRTAGAIAKVVVDIVVTAARIASRLAGMTGGAFAPAVDDVNAQLARLVYPGFARGVGRERLADLQRYLAAIEHRLDKLGADVARDARLMAEVNDVERAYDALIAAWPAHRSRAELVEIGWMIEELRVGTFAQVLRTAYPISAKRVRREIDRLTTA